MSPENSKKLNDFKDELLSRIFKTLNLLFRQDTSLKFLLIPGRRKRFNLIIVESFEQFCVIFKKISPDTFKFNGFFLIVLIDGDIPETEEIFKLMWKIQIYNVVVMFEDSNGVVKVVTFLPFGSKSCNQTTPTVIDEFRDGKFANGSKDLFHDKMKNLQGCPIRVAIANNAEPYVFFKLQANGSKQLVGTEISLIQALSTSLNFNINFTFIGDDGYLYENGSAKGPLKVLLDREADLSLSDWYLKNSRLKFFDSTTSYVSDQVIFLVPPGRDLTTFEKLVDAFKLSIWILIISCFVVGFVVIFSLKRQTLGAQNFVFGVNVRHPYFNMFAGFIGSSQKVLPSHNFARFLLMLFLMYSLVMRSVYQGSFYRLTQSNKRQKEVQSIDEMINKDFKIYGTVGGIEVVGGSETLKSRCKNRFRL